MPVTNLMARLEAGQPELTIRERRADAVPGPSPTRPVRVVVTAATTATVSGSAGSAQAIAGFLDLLSGFPDLRVEAVPDFQAIASKIPTVDILVFAADSADAARPALDGRDDLADWLVLIPAMDSRHRFEHEAAILIEAGAVDVLPANWPDRLPVVVRRLADRRRWLEHHQVRDRLLTDLLAASPNACTIADPFAPDMPLIYVNMAFTEITGYPLEQVIGRNCRFLQGPDTAPGAVAQLRSAIERRRTVAVELLNHRRSGEPFWNRLTVGPVHDRHGDLLAFIGVQTDVSEERRREAALRQSQKLEALGLLASGLAHELNNMIHPILNHAIIALNELGPDHPRAHNLTTIRDCGRRMRDVVQNVLSFARPQAGPPEAATDLGQAVADACTFARQSLPPDVRLETDCASVSMQAQINRSEVIQVVLNLTANGADAMDGSGTIALSLSCRIVDAVEAAQAGIAQGPYAKLVVEDNGCGMTSEVLERIFEPFYTTKEVGLGTGLGLSVVFGIVSRWGGKVTVDSRPGAGTRFDVLIPLTNMCRPDPRCGPEPAVEPQTAETAE